MKTSSNKSERIMLDNAAKIYPAAMTKTHNSVYRVSAYLKQTVDAGLLKQAVADLAPRFPTFYVQLTKGVCWYYLEKVNNYDIVVKESEAACRPMNVGTDDKPMFRVLYNYNKISAEFFHSITDGTGAVTYLKTLTARYLELQGHHIEKTCGVLDINDLPSDDETKDAFLDLYRKDYKMSRKEADAYHYQPESYSETLRTISGIIPLDMLKPVVKNKYNCTVTEYLVSVYAFAFMEKFRADKNKINTGKPIKISVPVNLRPYFGASTLRNFASFANVAVYPDKAEKLEDVIETVKSQMNEMITKYKLHCAVSQNVSEEKMIISKYSPLFLKTPVMKICYKLFGDKKYTSTLSNIGLIKVPESMEQFIERFDFVLGGGKSDNAMSCAVIGFKNKLTVTFSSMAFESDIEKRFFEIISADGIIVDTLVNGIAVAA